MTNYNADYSPLPVAYRDGFKVFSDVLLELAGDNAVGLSAYGGWLNDDPFYAGAPARGVVVLKQVDLIMLDQLAAHAPRFGKANVVAPLMMTPEYIKSSCDVFPLELLEIQQLHALVFGEDHFADLTFDRGDVRLQCERELKGELIQLRHGLLAAGGKHKLLPELCRNVAARLARMLRGVLHLGDVAPAPKRTREMLDRAAEICDIKLDTLADIYARPAIVELDMFQKFYDEVDALTHYADTLTND